MTSLEYLKEYGEAPEWLTESGLTKLKSGYLNNGETPRAMWSRVATAAATRLGKSELKDRFFNLFWNNWLGLATPVASNMGLKRGLPISCYTLHVPDSTTGIFQKVHELAMLSKHGGGVGVYLGDVRGRMAGISTGGYSEGIVPWSKVFDATTISISQGAVRRGATALYLPIDHPDIREFLRIRRPEGDHNRQCPNIHQAVCITDEFMHKVGNGDTEARELLIEVYKTRLETGEPYIFFTDNVNKQNPQVYQDRGLRVHTSNLCSEIMLHTSPEETLVCCLSSLNLARWEEWKDTDAVYDAIWFLDAVMSEFISRAEEMPGFDCAVRFAKKSRPLGLGAMGWHTLLQSEGTPFDSLRATILNKAIWSYIKKEAVRASQDLAKEYGEPEMMRGYGLRNSHLLAVAPTVSNAQISGNVSPSIDPLPANAFIKKSSSGTLGEFNPVLKHKLAELGKDTQEVWTKIIQDGGSVRSIDFLNDFEKDVFKTSFEIDQLALVNQAADRQKYICQGQSLNLFFSDTVDPVYFHDVHWLAWTRGIKSLYYCRSSPVLKADLSSRESCRSCEG